MGKRKLLFNNASVHFMVYVSHFPNMEFTQVYLEDSLTVTGNRNHLQMI